MKEIIDNLVHERRLLSEGYKLIAGTDEVGRGPIVGPVVAAAVVMSLDKDDIIPGVTDSKRLSEKKREELAEIIKEKAISYSISYVTNEKIDEINILEASRLAMMNAIKKLKVKPDIVISDYMELKFKNIDNLSLVKGDLYSYSVACASIVAKVERDNYMNVLHKDYPMYDYVNNKGYPTKKHLEAIEKYGITELYRKSYKPVQKIINKKS